MCKAMEDLRDQAFQEGVREGVREGEEIEKKATALRMLKAGRYTLEEIAYINELSLNEVKKLQAMQDA